MMVVIWHRHEWPEVWHQIDSDLCLKFWNTQKEHFIMIEGRIGIQHLNLKLRDQKSGSALKYPIFRSEFNPIQPIQSCELILKILSQRITLICSDIFHLDDLDDTTLTFSKWNVIAWKLQNVLRISHDLELPTPIISRPETQNKTQLGSISALISDRAEVFAYSFHLKLHFQAPLSF